MRRQSFFMICSGLCISLGASIASAVEIGKGGVKGTYQISAKTTMTHLQSLPDNQIVRMSNGREVPAANLKALANFIRTAKKAPGKPPQKFIMPAGAAQVQVQKGFNLHALSSRNNSDVIQLPSGRKMTVDQFKKIDMLAKITTGKSLLERQPAEPVAKGPAIKIKSVQDLKALAGKPDSTLLESPLGKKITLGELKEYAKKNGKDLGVK